MKKYELRENGFLVEEIGTKRRTINILWLIFTVLMIAATFIALLAVIEYAPSGGSSPIDISVKVEKLPFYFIELLFSAMLYYVLKLVATLMFCRDRQNSARLKFIDDTKLPEFPVCHCKEAFTAWQTVAMYIAPVIVVYALMFLLCVVSPIDTFANGDIPFETVDGGYMTMLFFMSFFMGFDLTLIAYTVYFKVKRKIDYISIDHHIYGVTLFKKTYVRFNRKKLVNNNDKYMEDGKFKWQKRR